jgi:hypothetical protein
MAVINRNTFYRQGFGAVHPLNQLNLPKPVRRSETAADLGSDKKISNINYPISNTFNQ